LEESILDVGAQRHHHPRVSNFENAMDPLQLLDYLISQGWKALATGSRDRLYVLEHDAYPARQIVFPMDESVFDYERCVSRTIEHLSNLTSVPVPTLLARVRLWRDEDIRPTTANLSQEDEIRPAITTHSQDMLEMLLADVKPTVGGGIGVFVGTVECLDGFIDRGGRRAGDAMLNLLLPGEGRMVLASVTLDADGYEKAITAHKTIGAYVRVIGRLCTGGHPTRLMGVSLFEILDQPLRPVA